jgi:serine/threonine protein kinase
MHPRPRIDPPTLPTGNADPFHWLRLAIVHEHPGYSALLERLNHAEAAVWLAAAGSSPPGSDPATALLASLHRDCRRPATTAPAELELDPLLRDEALAAIADLAPGSHATWAQEKLQEFATARTAAPSPIPFASQPRRVGAYELLELIGHGASSTVYKGRHLDNDMLAAVKLLRLETADTEGVVRFRTEARIAGRLRHPSIAQILDSGVETRGGSTVPYLVYAFAEGRPFAQALAHTDVRRTVRVFATLCEAIAYAHRHGVLHRDLKSANVLVDAADRVAVLDFGIARLIEGGSIHRTDAGQVLGTPQTMSPEQASGRPVDARSDVWSLGAMLFEALTGDVPFDLRGKSGAAALRCIGETEPRRLQSLRTDLDADLVAIVHRAIATDPDARYPSVEHLQEDLERWRNGLQVAARRLRTWPSLWRFARRHRLASAAIVTAILAIVCGSALAGWQWRRAHVAEALAREAALETLHSLESTLFAFARLAETATDGRAQQQVLDDALAALARVRAMPVTAESHRWLAVEARIREILGDLALRAAAYPEARLQRQTVLRLQEQLQTVGAGRAVDLARAVIKVGDLEKQHSFDAALPHYRRAHALLEAAQTAHPDDLEIADDLLWSHERLAAAGIAAADQATALAHSAQQVALAERLLQVTDGSLRHYALASALDLHRQCRDQARQPTDAAALALRLRAREHVRRALTFEPHRRAFLNLAIAIELHLAFDPAVDDPRTHWHALREAERLATTWIASDPADLDANDRMGQILKAQAQRAGRDAHDPPAIAAHWQRAIDHAERLAAQRPAAKADRFAANRLRAEAFAALAPTAPTLAEPFAQAIDGFWRSQRDAADVPPQACQDAESWYAAQAPAHLRDAGLARWFADQRSGTTDRD